MVRWKAYDQSQQDDEEQQEQSGVAKEVDRLLVARQAEFRQVIGDFAEDDHQQRECHQQNDPPGEPVVRAEEFPHRLSPAGYFDDAGDFDSCEPFTRAGAGGVPAKRNWKVSTEPNDFSLSFSSSPMPDLSISDW